MTQEVPVAPEPIIIGVLGFTGAGKSNFIRKVTGDENIIASRRLKSCTKKVQAATTFEMDGRTIQLVDTPGFSDDGLSDSDVLRLIATWMKESLNDQKMHGIIYLHDITSARMDTGALRSVKLFGNICGPNFLENTVMITTRWDTRTNADDYEESQDVEKDLLSEYWSRLLKVDTGVGNVQTVEVIGSESGTVVELEEFAGGTGDAMYARSNNRRETCEEIIRRIVAKLPKAPLLKEEIIAGRGLDETAAGAGLLEDIKATYQKRIEELEIRLKTFEEEKASLQERIRKLEMDQKYLYTHLMGRALCTLINVLGKQIFG